MTTLFKLSMDLMMLGVAAILFAKARVIWREGSQNYIKVHGPPRSWTIKKWCSYPPIERGQR